MNFCRIIAEQLSKDLQQYLVYCKRLFDENGGKYKAGRVLKLKNEAFKKSMRLSLRTNRFTAAHEHCRLMLLGSPPDMVHGGPSHRTRTSAYLKARIFWHDIQFYRTRLDIHFITLFSKYQDIFTHFTYFFAKFA